MNIKLFNKSISIWLIVGIVAAIGGGVWYYIHHHSEAAKKAAADKKAKEDAAKVGATGKQQIYVPGAGTVTI